MTTVNAIVVVHQPGVAMLRTFGIMSSRIAVSIVQLETISRWRNSRLREIM
jgi:hypothetical protein